MSLAAASASSPRSRRPSGALQAVALELVENHLNHRVAEAITSGGAGVERKVAEDAEAIARLVKS